MSGQPGIVICFIRQLWPKPCTTSPECPHNVPKLKQFNRFLFQPYGNMAVNSCSVPGLLTGEGGRKLAGMDLRRSFCSATMKGSFKCSEGGREREQASITQLAPGVHAGHMHKKPFSFVFYVSVSLTGPLSRLPDALIWRLWYFSWIAGHTINVKVYLPTAQAEAGYIPTHHHVWHYSKSFITLQGFLLRPKVVFHSKWLHRNKTSRPFSK